MHVRHVVRQFYPVVGGLENTVASLVLALRDQGVEGSIVTLNREFQNLGETLPAQDDFHGVPVRRIPFSGSTKYPIAPNVLRMLDGADVVHVHAIDFFFDFLALTSIVHRKPLVASTHGGFFHTSFASKLKQIYFNTVTRSSAMAYKSIIGSSDNDAQTFRRIASRNTVAIENGVDVLKWKDCASKSLTQTLLSLGRFSTNKALEDLIVLISNLGPPWRLIIAGFESDLSETDLREIALLHGVSDRVEIHVGLDEAGVRSLVERASYIASASRFEGFGLTALEGMSAGLLPILNDIPPFRKVVTQTGCGLVIHMPASVAASEAVAQFHAKVELQHAGLRQQAIQTSEAHGWPGVAEQFLERYRQALRL